MRSVPSQMIVAVCVTALAVNGCTDPQAGAPSGSAGRHASGTTESTSANDPELSSAADRVDRIVHPRYARWYAGMVLNHPSRTMTVYRKPGSGLDTAVRAQVTGVTVRFRTAQLSEEEMLALVRRVLADTSYWHGQGITGNGGGPLPDGSGVSVMTAAGTAQESARMSRHYGSGIVAVRGSAVPATAGRFRPTPPGVSPS